MYLYMYIYIYIYMLIHTYIFIYIYIYISEFCSIHLYNAVVYMQLYCIHVQYVYM